MKYIFTSDRLGFRNWRSSDLTFLNKLNSNKEVMKYFPKTSSKNENMKFILKMKSMFNTKGYCYFVVESLQSKEIIGFIGLAYQDYEAEFTPAIDIGWRLMPEFWGKGFATEGARRVLIFAQNDLQIKTIFAITPVINHRSIEIMERIGMSYQYDFNHSKLQAYKSIERCSLYSANL